MQDQKKMLIDSMRKLISHVSMNKEHQIEIYRSLTKGDLTKILTNLEDPNPTLRKMSAKLVCELLYKNASLKQQFAQLMGIRPVNGHIVINKIPDALIKRPDRILEAMNLLKQGGETLQISNKSLCWFIDPFQPELTISLIDSGQEELVDPKDYLLGISAAPETNPSKAVHQSVVLELRESLRQHRPRTSVTSADTDRYTRGIRQIRFKKEDKMNVTQDEFKVQSKILTSRKQEDRVRTDESQYLRYRAKGSSFTGCNSPQTSIVRGIDKTLRQKKNQKPGISLINSGQLSDRAQRDIQFNSKIRTNTFVNQTKNNFLIGKDISSGTRLSKPRVQASSHRQSFDGNYKPSEIFLKKFRDSERKLY